MTQPLFSIQEGHHFLRVHQVKPERLEQLHSHHLIKVLQHQEQTIMVQLAHLLQVVDKHFQLLRDQA